MSRPNQSKRSTSIYTRAGLVSAATAATMLALPPSSADAHSSKPKPFKEASIALENIREAPTTLRVQHDGIKYTHLEGDLSATFRLKAKVKAGHRIYGWVVTTGDPVNEGALPDFLKGAEKNLKTKSLDTLATFLMDAETAVSTGIWGTPPTSAQDIVDRCNVAFPELPASDRSNGHIDLTVHAGFAAGKRRRDVEATAQWYNGNAKSRPAIAHTTLPVNIICAGNPANRAAEKPPAPRAGNTLHSIDLKVSQKGERCPKDVTVTAFANYKWQAKSRMRVAVNGGFPKARVVNTKKVTFAGKTFHRAETQFKYTLDPGQKSFKLTVDRGEKRHSETVEITCPPFKVTSAWLKYDVEDKAVCPKKVKETATFHTTRPGWVNHEIKMAGGLVVSFGKLTSKRVGDKYVATAVRNLTVNAIDKEFMADAVDYPANSGWMPLKVKCLDLSGDFSFVDKGPPKCSRTGRSLITFKSNLPDAIDYSLDCTNGQKLSGSVKPVMVGQDQYVGTAVESFAIDKTSVYSCALKTAQPGPVKLHQWKSHKFDCVHRAVETGSNDLVPPSRPTSGAKIPFKDFTVEKDTDSVEWPGAGGVRLDVRPVVDPVRPDPRKPVNPGAVNEGRTDKSAAEKRRKAREAAAKAERLRKARDAKAQAERLRKARDAKAKAERLRKQREAKAKAERLRKAKLHREMLRKRAEQAEARKKAKKRSERKSSRKRRAATNGNGKARVMRLR